MPRKSARVARVERDLKRRATAARARTNAWFFRTGPGEYGEGDRFLGVTTPQLRAVVRTCDDLTLADVEQLLESPWHEVRLAGTVILAHRYPRVDAAAQRAIYALYLRRSDRINNWDLVDSSAPQVVGGHLMTRSRAPLHRLARSRDLWERRIAIVATLAFIRAGQFRDTLRLAVTLIDDPHDLIHKATGWMLREVGKQDLKSLRAFLDRYAHRLPRTALRYSIERLSPSERRRYMRQGP